MYYIIGLIVIMFLIVKYLTDVINGINTLEMLNKMPVKKKITVIVLTVIVLICLFIFASENVSDKIFSLLSSNNLINHQETDDVSENQTESSNDNEDIVSETDTTSFPESNEEDNSTENTKTLEQKLREYYSRFSKEEMLDFQMKLKQLGYLSVDASNEFSEDFVIAVKSFQEANSLKVDGYIGDQTLQAINSLINSQNSHVPREWEINGYVASFYHGEFIRYDYESGFIKYDGEYKLNDVKLYLNDIVKGSVVILSPTKRLNNNPNSISICEFYDGVNPVSLKITSGSFYIDVMIPNQVDVFNQKNSFTFKSVSISIYESGDYYLTDWVEVDSADRLVNN